jgi:hypothetical protein
VKKFAIIAGLLLSLIVPSRGTQAATSDREKLWSALRAAAVRQGANLPEQVQPEDIHFSSSLSGSDAPIQVQAISFDPLLHQLRFRFRQAGNASAPWFSGWCQTAPPDTTGHAAATAEHHSPNDPVSTRRLAILHLRSENSFATLQVHPLESGTLGQSIRVRVPSNGHTLRARVVSIDTLEATF